MASISDIKIDNWRSLANPFCCAQAVKQRQPKKRGGCSKLERRFKGKTRDGANLISVFLPRKYVSVN
jgi:hypothetical protein